LAIIWTEIFLMAILPISRGVASAGADRPRMVDSASMSAATQTIEAPINAINTVSVNEISRCCQDTGCAEKKMT
jgi:hypothetical protein